MSKRLSIENALQDFSFDLDSNNPAISELQNETIEVNKEHSAKGTPKIKEIKKKETDKITSPTDIYNIPVTDIEQTYNKSITDNESKPITNIEQTYNKSITDNESKPITNIEQTYDISITDKKQVCKNKPSFEDSKKSVDQIIKKMVTAADETTDLRGTYNIPITNSESKPVTGVDHTYNKPIPNIEHSYNIPVINIKHTYNKHMSEPISDIEQTYNKKIERKSPLHHLSDLQKNILFLLFKKCVDNQSIVTEPIPTEVFETSLKRSYGTIKTTINRLKKKELLHLVDFKGGRGGWSIYRLDENIYKEINTHLNLFPVTNIEQTYNKPMSETVTNAPSSSISFNNTNKELTTNEQKFYNPGLVEGQQQLGPEFDPEWQSIDVSPLESIGFSHNHLSQLFVKGELTAKQMQESIYAFAFDLEENKRGEKVKTSPLNLFMGILKGGNPYNPPKNYESDIDRILREQIQAEKERLEKRKQLKAKLKDLKYQNWLMNLSIDNKLDILDVPHSFFEKMPIEAINDSLKKHFDMKVFSGGGV